MEEGQFLLPMQKRRWNETGTESCRQEGGVLVLEDHQGGWNPVWDLAEAGRTAEGLAELGCSRPEGLWTLP